MLIFFFFFFFWIYIDFPDTDMVSGCTGTLILTCRASGNGDGLCTEKVLDNLQQVIYLGTKGYIKINDWVNIHN